MPGQEMDARLATDPPGGTKPEGRAAHAAAQLADTASVPFETPVESTGNVDRLLRLWFDLRHGLDWGMRRWFIATDDFDAALAPWAPMVAAARAGRLDGWTATADGALALLLLLDQLPRNLWRGQGTAFASDEQALRVAAGAIARGLDRAVPLERQMFFYLPLMHREDLPAQVGCLGLYQGMLARATPHTELHALLHESLQMCQGHVDVIRRFGRYPGRNAALGRVSTAEELRFLEETDGRGF